MKKEISMEDGILSPLAKPPSSNFSVGDKIILRCDNIGLLGDGIFHLSNRYVIIAKKPERELFEKGCSYKIQITSLLKKYGFARMITRVFTKEDAGDISG